jgi:hypothetical protein
MSSECSSAYCCSSACALRMVASSPPDSSDRSAATSAASAATTDGGSDGGGSGTYECASDATSCNDSRSMVACCSTTLPRLSFSSRLRLSSSSLAICARPKGLGESTCVCICGTQPGIKVGGTGDRARR